MGGAHSSENGWTSGSGARMAAPHCINKKTDTLLLAVEFKDITFGSNENYFRFHRKGKEPIETMTFFNVTKASFVTTIIIPNLSDLQIQDGEVFTYNNDPTRGLVVGPTAFISSAEYLNSGIARPCRVFDMFCIRQHFVKHSHCNETFGPAPTPLYKAQSTFYVPRVNMSVTSLKVEYTGINGRVEEFYINEKTDKLLLAVQFTNFVFGSNENYFRFHRKGREPIVTMDFFNVSYTSLVVTIIIPKLEDLQLQDSEVFLYSNDFTPVFVVGPRAFSSPDPQEQQTLLQTFVAFIAQTADDIKEGFATDAHFLIASFIKYNICDFGLQIL
ncbi:jg6150 [Pararge aegeria aegeria]|uniref:Jg6150 protein n=1 Tax=Pararge aegeria aegeria TaxID=348720 RepID=A0A8S4RBT9_9NEOP|nr:jg6150 [Pararge aegeria aegeria]